MESLARSSSWLLYTFFSFYGIFFVLKNSFTREFQSHPLRRTVRLDDLYHHSLRYRAIRSDLLNFPGRILSRSERKMIKPSASQIFSILFGFSFLWASTGYYFEESNAIQSTGYFITEFNWLSFHNGKRSNYLIREVSEVFASDLAGFFNIRVFRFVNVGSEIGKCRRWVLGSEFCLENDK